MPLASASARLGVFGSAALGAALLYATLSRLADPVADAFVLLLSLWCALWLGARSPRSLRWRRVLAAAACVIALAALGEAGALVGSRLAARWADSGVEYNGMRQPFWTIGGPLGLEPPRSVTIRAIERDGSAIVYDVGYSFDADGRRLTQADPAGRCTFLVYGDAAFGLGLSDVETLPHLLSRALSFEADVRNMGFLEQGAHQMLRSLELGAGGDARATLRAVVYLWSPQDALRASGWSPLNRHAPRYVAGPARRAVHRGALSSPLGALRWEREPRQALRAMLRSSRAFELAYGYPERERPDDLERSAARLAAIVATARRLVAERFRADLLVVPEPDGSVLSNLTLAALQRAGVVTEPPWSNDVIGRVNVSQRIAGRYPGCARDA